jgi:hypothetical protein
MQNITDRTQELATEVAGRTRAALVNARQALAERAREERGQISAEFMGLLFIVALVIGAIVALGIHDDIANAIDGFIGNIKSGDKPAGAPESAG